MLPPIEGGVQPLEVAPPEGWRPANDTGIEVFVTLCYGSDCASSDDPGALEELRSRHKNDTDAGTGGPGKDNPDDEPELPYPSVPGVYSDDVKAFIDFTIDMIEQTLINYPAASGRGINWNLENFAEGLFALILIFSRQSLGEFDPNRLNQNHSQKCHPERIKPNSYLDSRN